MNESGQDVYYNDEEAPIGSDMLRASSSHGLAQEFLEAGIIKSIDVLNGLSAIDRANYAINYPYEDSAQPIGFGQFIAAPHVHASALEQLAPTILNENCRALDIGCGSGYLTAVIARMNPTATVYGIDSMAPIVKNSISNVMKKDSDLIESGRVKLFVGDGWYGLEAHSPYDCIYVGAAMFEMPTKVMAQLKIGGLMLVPVGPENDTQNLLLIERLTGGVDKTDFKVSIVTDVMFAPLVLMNKAAGKQDKKKSTEPRTVAPTGQIPLLMRKPTKMSSRKFV